MHACQGIRRSEVPAVGTCEYDREDLRFYEDASLLPEP